MSNDKNINQEINEMLKIQERIRLVKKQAKRQRVKMRKRGIRVIQDYCN